MLGYVAILSLHSAEGESCSAEADREIVCAWIVCAWIVCHNRCDTRWFLKRHRRQKLLTPHVSAPEPEPEPESEPEPEV